MIDNIDPIWNVLRDNLMHGGIVKEVPFWKEEVIFLYHEDIIHHV